MAKIKRYIVQLLIATLLLLNVSIHVTNSHTKYDDLDEPHLFI